MLLELLLNPIFYFPPVPHDESLSHICASPLNILKRPDGLCLQDLDSFNTCFQPQLIWTWNLKTSSTLSESSQPYACRTHFRRLDTLSKPKNQRPEPCCTSSSATGMSSSSWYLFDQVIPFEINDLAFLVDSFPFWSVLVRFCSFFLDFLDTILVLFLNSQLTDFFWCQWD